MNLNLCSDPKPAYTSCILVNGRPILPPILSPDVSEEMNSYRNMAMAIERKLLESRRRNENRQRTESELSNNSLRPLINTETVPNDFRQPTERAMAKSRPDTSMHPNSFDVHSDSWKPIANADTTNSSSRSSTLKDFRHPHSSSDLNENSFGTAPSVASTGLTRYMATTSRLGAESSYNQSQYSNSQIRPDTGSTAITTTEYDFPTSLYSVDHRLVEPAHHVTDEAKTELNRRRSSFVRQGSYTLDQPSPALLRAHPFTSSHHHKNVEIDDVVTNRNPETFFTNTTTITTTDDEVYESFDPTSASSAATANGSTTNLQSLDKERHLHRYLSQMASLNLDDVTDGRVSNGHVVNDICETGLAGNFNSDATAPDHERTDNGKDGSESEGATLFQEMLQEQVQHFRKLKADLEENHRRHMDELKLQFADEFRRLSQRFNGGSDSKSDRSNQAPRAIDIQQSSQQLGESSSTSVDVVNGGATATSNDSRQRSPLVDGASLTARRSDSSESAAYESVDSSPTRQLNSSVVGNGKYCTAATNRWESSKTGYDNHGHTCWEQLNKDEKRWRRRVDVRQIANHTGFCHLSAAVKGYLTRRLMRTNKVQEMIDKIKDTLEFAVKLHSESPLRRGCINAEDATLHQNLIAQLSNTCHDFHDVFFTLTTKERMAIIARDRQLQRDREERLLDDRKRAFQPNKRKPLRVSSATVKVMERRRERLSGSGRRSNSPASDILKVSGKSKTSPKVTKKILRSTGVHRRAFSTSPQMKTFAVKIPLRVRSQSELSNALPQSSSRRNLYGK